MRYIIVGAGGVGGCVGGYLALAGNDVTIIARGEHLKEIKSKGLTVNSAEKGSFNVKVNACTMDEFTGAADVIFVCVKYYSIKEAIDFVKRAADSHTAVIPLLNVFGTGERMQSELPNVTVTDGCIYIYSYIENPGVIAKPSEIFKIYFGLREGQSSNITDRLITVENDLMQAGIEAYLCDNIKKETFRKFTYVSPIGAAGLLCNAVAADFLKEGEARDTVIAMMGELLSLGRAMGIEYEEDMVQVNLKILAGLEPDAKTSMQRDIEAGRQSEADGLICRVAEAGKKYGVDMPLYDKAAKIYG